MPAEAVVNYNVNDFSEYEFCIAFIAQYTEVVLLYPAVCGPLAYAEECLKLLTVDPVFAFRIGE